MTQNASMEMKEGDLEGYAKIDISHRIMYNKTRYRGTQKPTISK